MIWLIICSGFILYSYFWQILESRGIHLPAIVPSFHFLFYLKALEAILFGYGLVLLSRFVIKSRRYLPAFLKRRAIKRQSDYRKGEKVVLSLLLLIIFVVFYPSYGMREAFTESRQTALMMNQRYDEIAAFSWIQAHTQPNDVFLASDDFALFVIGPAGRKVVAVELFFSNPYVDWKVRNRDRDLMFEYLRLGEDQREFRDLAAKYKVTHLMVPADQFENIGLPAFLRLEFATDKIHIFRVTL